MKRILRHPGNKTDWNMLLPKVFLKMTIVLLVAVWLAACAVVGPSKPPTPDILKKDQLPQKVAIIPFVNRTSNPEAGAIVRKMFYNFFSSLNYFDIEPLAVDDRLREKNLYRKIIAGESVSPQKIGQFLGVDAIIIGEVLSLGKIYALLYADTQAGLNARMIDCNSKNVWEPQKKIWSISAIGMDRDGYILFIHSRSPYSTHDFIDILLKLPIHLKRAMYVEGGPQAQMFFKTKKTEMQFVGSYSTGSNENDRNKIAWPLPNVIGIARKPIAKKP